MVLRQRFIHKCSFRVETWNRDCYICKLLFCLQWSIDAILIFLFSFFDLKTDDASDFLSFFCTLISLWKIILKRPEIMFDLHKSFLDRIEGKKCWSQFEWWKAVFHVSQFNVNLRWEEILICRVLIDCFSSVKNISTTQTFSWKTSHQEAQVWNSALKLFQHNAFSFHSLKSFHLCIWRNVSLNQSIRVWTKWFQTEK